MTNVCTPATSITGVTDFSPVAPLKKPLPLAVILLPPPNPNTAGVGVSESTESWYSNCGADDESETPMPSTTTVTVPFPITPAPATHVMDIALDSMTTHGVLPNMTLWSAMLVEKPEPEIVTLYPPPTAPAGGRMLKIVGTLTNIEEPALLRVDNGVPPGVLGVRLTSTSSAAPPSASSKCLRRLSLCAGPRVHSN